MARAAVLLLFLAWATPAVAEQPLLRPSRDVDITYQAAAPQNGRMVEQRVRWLAAAQTMRIDPPSPGLHVIVDYLARRMSVIRDSTRSVVEMAADNGTDLTGADAAASFVRHGEATVAGRTCVEWETRDREAHPVLVCITDDGVLLRAGTAGRVRVSAISVRYEPQDPATFSVPSDYAHFKPGTAP